MAASSSCSHLFSSHLRLVFLVPHIFSRQVRLVVLEIIFVVFMGSDSTFRVRHHRAFLIVRFTRPPPRTRSLVPLEILLTPCQASRAGPPKTTTSPEWSSKFVNGSPLESPPNRKTHESPTETLTIGAVLSLSSLSWWSPSLPPSR